MYKFTKIEKNVIYDSKIVTFLVFFAQNPLPTPSRERWKRARSDSGCLTGVGGKERPAEATLPP